MPPATDATVESLMGMAPVLLGVLAVLSPCCLVDRRRYRWRRHLLFTSSAPQPGSGSPGCRFVVANILRGIFGSIAVPRWVGVASMVIPAGAAAVGYLAVAAGRQAAVAVAAGRWRQLRRRWRVRDDGAMAGVAVIAEGSSE